LVEILANFNFYVCFLGDALGNSWQRVALLEERLAAQSAAFATQNRRS